MKTSLIIAMALCILGAIGALWLGIAYKYEGDSPYFVAVILALAACAVARSNVYEDSE